MKISAIVPAAGSGQRMGGSARKQFLEILGQPVIIHALRRLSASPLVGQIILMAPAEELEQTRRMAEGAQLCAPINVASGGATRQESVAKGFGHVDPGAELVLVHDGVRPFVSAELVEQVAQAAWRTGASTAACRVRDTLKRARDGKLAEPIPRDDAVHIQTPQCFRYSILAEALERAEKEGISATDESSLVQRIGMDVAMVEAPFWNIKITTPDDMILAEALAQYLAVR